MTRTMGEVYPRLLQLPGYEEIARRPYDGPPHSIDPAVRDRVNSCAHRGPEGGLAATDEERAGCCGGGPERTACSAGKGRSPGRVTLAECLRCMARPPAEAGKVRVGICCPCLANGGAERQQITMARYVDPAKVEWRGCCVVGGYGDVDPAIRAETEALMPVTEGVPAAIALGDQCDVLLTWAVGGLPEIVAALVSRPKVVAIVHAPPESEWGKTVYARPGGIDLWVAVSDIAMAAIPGAALAGAPATVILNAVDPARLRVRRPRATMWGRWDVPPGAKVAGYLGRLSFEKDPLAMLRLASALPDPWHVVVVGAGGEWPDDYRHRRVHRIGPDPAAGDVLNAFDVLVVPSLYESFGLTIAEGLMMPIPVVSTDVGLARMFPGMTTPIPFHADGRTLADAVKAAFRGGPGGTLRAAEAIGIERFARAWTGLIYELGAVALR